MTTRKQWDLERRIVRVAEAALAQRKFVTVIDVLVGLGWLPPAHLDSWRQGRIDCLECTMTVNLNKLSTALRFFRVWARRRGLRPSETAYVARTRDRRRLRFSVNADPDIERAYRTQWVSPELSERERERLAKRESRPPDLVVIVFVPGDPPRVGRFAMFGPGGTDLPEGALRELSPDGGVERMDGIELVVPVGGRPRRKRTCTRREPRWIANST